MFVFWTVGLIKETVENVTVYLGPRMGISHNFLSF